MVINAFKRPNVVLITLDECKASVLGCYGDKYAYTPNMDRLAEEGMLFENSYTTFPKCVPSRAALVTGRYPHVEGHRTLPGFEVTAVENNFVKVLKDNGYITGMFGKNHTFDKIACNEFLSEYPGPKGIDVPWERREFEDDDKLFRAFYRGDFSDIDAMLDTIATEDSCNFIVKNRDNPFFLLLNYNAPHPPYTGIKPFIDIIKERGIELPEIEKLEDTPHILKKHREIYDLEMLQENEWRKIVEAYYGMVSYVDSQIGILLKKIEDAGLKENTIVILTSDHGDFAGEHGCVEKWDTLFYDCLIKVPLIISWPGAIKKGRSAKTMVENVDIAPTILKLCGFKVPKWMQGKDLCDVLDNEYGRHRDMVFCEGGVEKKAIDTAVDYNSEEQKKRHPNYLWKQKIMVDYPFTLYRSKMVRTGRWKMIYRIDGDNELYDMINDPGEFVDVSAKPENREIAVELMEHLIRWMMKTETDYPQIEHLNA